MPITVNYVSSNHALARLSVLLVGGGEGDYPDKPNDLPQVNHTFVGEVRVAHLLSFLCCIFILFVFVLFLMYPVLPVSLDCPFLIAPSVFSNVYVSHNVVSSAHRHDVFKILFSLFSLSICITYLSLDVTKTNQI